MIKKLLIIFAVAINLTACTNKTFVRSTPNYSNSIAKANFKVLLPPAVEIYEIDGSNKRSRLHNFEDKFEQILTEELINKFSDKGYKVRLVRRSEIANKKLYPNYNNVRDDAEDLLADLYKTGAWEAEKAHSIQNKITPTISFGKAIDADLIVIANFMGETKSSGALTKDLAISLISTALLGGHNSNAVNELSSLKLALIEASTGKVLWTNLVATHDYILGTGYTTTANNRQINVKSLTKLIESALVKL